MAYLELKNLSIGYQDVPVVQNISMEIQKGEIVALIGPNGAGKSTLLKTIIRELPPISGSVLFEGQPIASYSYQALSKKIAVILTERIRVELTTCRDIVATGRYPYTGRFGILRKEDEQKVDEALEAVHATDLADRDFTAISDGQRQRVLLARAIAQEPELILLDEPTSFLDVRHKLELLSILTEMARKKNITVLMSLHEIDLAEKAADRIMTIKGDSLFAAGTPEEIFQEQRIRDLYDIRAGFYDPLFGSIELAKPVGEPQVFVVAGNGSGIPVYRDLQRRGIPFATGILYENDVDVRLARLLAAEMVVVPLGAPIPEEAIARAREIAARCKEVIVAPGSSAAESNDGAANPVPIR